MIQPPPGWRLVPMPWADVLPVRTGNAGRSNGERMTRTPIWHYQRPGHHVTLCGVDTAGWTMASPDRPARICQKCARDLRRRQ